MTLILTLLLTTGDGKAPTFAEHIAPVVYRNCSGCHRPGQAGPFPLLTYEDVAKRARMIRTVIKDRYMPPWKPAPGHGDFKNERRLTDAEIAQFEAWIEAGRPKGENVPSPPTFAGGGWALGKPDLVLKMDRAYEVPADGPDIYRWFVLPLDLPEDKWVRAMEFRPSARSVVHHSLFFLDGTKTARDQDGKDGKPGFRGMRASITGQLGGYVPGSTPAFFPEDFALPLQAGSDVLLQTHFHPTGKKETEQSELALYFSKKPPSKRLQSIQLPPFFGRMAGIDIPAGESRYRIEDSFKLPVAVDAWSVGGHAHYICAEMKMTATLPDGKEQPLLYIDDWDLDWQDQYQYRAPVRLPAGTVIKTELRYDNSADNPDNPFSPPRRVKWGRESTDEMGSITLVVTAAEKSDDAELGLAILAHTGKKLGRAGRVGGALLEGLLKRIDKNGDGKVSKDEMPQRWKDRLLRADADGDGELDEKELETVRRFLKNLGGR